MKKKKERDLVQDIAILHGRLRDLEQALRARNTAIADHARQCDARCDQIMADHQLVVQSALEERDHYKRKFYAVLAAMEDARELAVTGNDVDA